MGCGFGDYLRHAVAHGAEQATGIDNLPACDLCFSVLALHYNLSEGRVGCRPPGATARDRNRVAVVPGSLIGMCDGRRRLGWVSGRAVGTHREGPRGGTCCSSVA
ncbi:hypothetical protein ACYSUO_39395 [Streptomyces sp. UC4497]